jgi:hypothetical protein
MASVPGEIEFLLPGTTIPTACVQRLSVVQIDIETVIQKNVAIIEQVSKMV